MMKLKCIMSPENGLNVDGSISKVFPITVGNEYEAIVTKTTDGFNYTIFDDNGDELIFTKFYLLFRIV